MHNKWLASLILLAVVAVLCHPYLTLGEVSRYGRPLYRRITAEVVGIEVRYVEELKWGNETFPSILKDRSAFGEALIHSFTSRVSRFGVKAVNCSVTFNETALTTVLECHVTGCVSKTFNRYTADFSWLLWPLGLDFIDSGFAEAEDGLSWRGDLEGVPAEVVVKLPPQEGPYKAWASPYGHCHAHVWWIGKP